MPDFQSRVIHDEVSVFILIFLSSVFTNMEKLFGYIIGGHDSTSTTLRWGFKFLADSGEAQSKLRFKIREYYPEAVQEKRLPTAKEITSINAPYLDAAIEELVRMAPETVDLLREQALPKGDAINTARIAGVMAAKRTPELIPLCHGLNLTSIDLEFTVMQDGVEITAEARASDRTGVEMEALTAVSVAALTLYDMCKAVDKGMVVEGVRLLEKTKEEAPEASPS